MSSALEATQITLQAYAQWVTIKIVNASSEQVVIKDVELRWGKFHQDGNKDAEIEVKAINNTSIKPNYPFQINACGRSGAASGTEGSFVIYGTTGKVVKCYWECPWGSKTNTWSVTPYDSNRWKVEHEGANGGSGALGNIKVDLYNIEK